jgi:hypothetical protein
MPNIELLMRLENSEILKAIQSSNKKKIERENNRRKRRRFEMWSYQASGE